MKKGKRLSALLSVLAICSYTTAQIPEGYYSSLAGKKGPSLKNAVYNLIKDAEVLSYGSGSGSTWDGFYSTDRLPNNQVVDRYSNDISYFTSAGAVISGMNIEHSFPKSWWGGSNNQAYKDLYNLMPCESKINSSKGNYAMGVVTNTKIDNGCTKVGTGSDGTQMWEPADKWKGDFARGYMYMATAYQNLTWMSNGLDMLTNGTYPTLQEWASDLLISWAKTDVVDKTETDRNEAVYKIQGNRNPFVDFPNLMEYIWGDSIDYAFDPATTKHSTDYNNGGSGDLPGGITELYYADYKTSDGGCTVETVAAPSTGAEIWTLSSKYGWVGTGYSNGTHAAEGSLLTPEIDLTEYKNATLDFNHALNFQSSPEEVMAVEVKCDGVATKLEGIAWPSGSNWTFNESGTISLADFTGKKIKIAFHYKSTDAVSGTWEIDWVKVCAEKNTTGISGVTIKDKMPDWNKTYEIYSIDGRRLSRDDDSHGIVIIRQGGKSWKIAK